MPIKNTKIQKFISFFLIIAIMAPAVLFSSPRQARAWPGASWLTDIFTSSTSVATGTSAGTDTVSLGIQFKNVAKEIGKQILMVVAKKALQELTKSTINWINSGFHGKPLFESGL